MKFWALFGSGVTVLNKNRVPVLRLLTFQGDGDKQQLNNRVQYNRSDGESAKKKMKAG